MKYTELRPPSGSDPPLNPRRGPIGGAIVATIAFLLAALIVLAQTGAGYDLTWWTVDGGGGATSTGGNYAMSATVGQPEVGVLMSSGEYTLAGGFWGGGGGGACHVYLPLLMRDSS